MKHILLRGLSWNVMHYDYIGGFSDHVHDYEITSLRALDLA
jgi:hypothetical protein